MKKIIYLFLIIFSYSTAEGQWLPDIFFNTSYGYNSFSRNVAAGNNIVHVVWHDYRLGTWEIYYKRSIDNGLNWGADTRLTFNSGQSDNPSIFANGLNVYIVWHDNTNGYFEIFYKRSSDGGINWGPDTRLTYSNYSSDALNSFHPSISVIGSFIHVVWHELRDGNREIYYKRSTDDGTSWESDTRLTNNSAESDFATISGSGSTVNVSWKDNRDGNFEIYQKLSTNNGINWSSDYRLTNYPGVSQSPSIYISGSNASVVWEDNRFGNSQIFFKKSTDGGLNWGSESEFTTSVVSSVRPSIISSGSKIHVTWYEESTHRIFYKYSSNSGISWNPNTYLTTTASGICHCTGPSITAADHAVHIVWTDYRQIYYKGNPSQNSTYTSLTSPNGGENFISGSIQNITWITNISSNIKLELTTNNGNSWSIITSSYPADSGRYSWTVPNISSTQCKIKISDSNDPSLFDISESSFTISPVTFNTGLIAYYPFNGNVNDESGNGYHGTNFGASLTTDKNGVLNSAYDFNGSSDYVSIPDFNILNINNLTFSCIVYPRNLNESVVVYHGYLGEIIMYTYSGNQLGVGVKLADTWWYDCKVNVIQNNWYLLTGVWERGNSLKLYLDGQLQTQTTVPDYDLWNTLYHHSSIGAYNRLEALPFDGKIDEVRFYNRALSEVEIQNLYGQSVATIQPSISVIPIQINPGGSVSIIGSNFTPSNPVMVIVENPNSQTVMFQDFYANSSGQLVASYSSNASSQAGIYKVTAFDISSNRYTQPRNFQINEPQDVFDLLITSPHSDSVGRIVDLEWKDKMILGPVYPVVNIKRYYKYNINFSTDNGLNWSSDFTSEGYDYIGSIQIFRKQINLNSVREFQNAENVKFKITDYLNPFRIVESENIPIKNSELSRSKVTLHWDYTYSQPALSPKGVCADGVSRVYIKVSKLDTSPSITSASVRLTDELGSSRSRELGSLKIATVTTQYSPEANDAYEIMVTNQNQNNYWFWYVSPTDFIRSYSDDENETERIVTARITVNYSDGTTESGSKDIVVIRPPLALVHGFSSEPGVWDDFHFEEANQIRYFKKDPRFKIGVAPKLDPKGSFDANARVILSLNQAQNVPPNENSILHANVLARRLGFASCQVYYVGHSMGGSVARVAAQHRYFNSYRNYHKGYIDRLITLDTPHDGSPWAWVVFSIRNFASSSISFQTFIRSKLGRSSINPLTCSFQPNGLLLEPTPAITNLAPNGYHFQNTNIPSYLIAGDAFTGETVDIDEYGLENPANVELDDMLTDITELQKIPGIFNLFSIPTNLFWDGTSFIRKKTLKILSAMYNRLNSSNSNNLLNSDLVVSNRSQLAGKSRINNENTFDRYNDLSTWGLGITHCVVHAVTSSVNVGNRVYELLNIQSDDSRFESIPESNDANLLNPILSETDNMMLDTINTLTILSPNEGENLHVDSSFNVTFTLSDTLGLKFVNVFFQDKNYYDTVKRSIYSMRLIAISNELEECMLSIQAVYDKNDSVKYSNEMRIVNVINNQEVLDFVVDSDFFNLLKNEIAYPKYVTLFNNGICEGTLDGIGAAIDNSSIVSFDQNQKTFRANSFGETFAVVSNGNASDTIYFRVEGEIVMPGVVNLAGPIDSATVQPGNVKFSWKADELAWYYEFQLAKDVDFESILFESENLSDTATSVEMLEENQIYYWRVRATNSGGSGNWSNVRTLKVLALRESYLYLNLIPQGLYNTALGQLNRKDTVRVYLTNIYPPFNIVDSSISVLDSITFQGLFKFPNTPTGNHYIKIAHFNSIETWSKTGGEYFKNHDKMYFDLTSSQDQAYGDNTIMIDSLWCIFSGDVNQDGTVDGTDLSAVDNDAANFISGYVTTDLTGDGFVDGTDFSIADNNAASFVGVVRP